MLVICTYGFHKLAIVEAEQHEKQLKNEIEKTKLIIEELKK